MKELPIDTRNLFRPLQGKLIELLKSLDADDWNRQTVAKQWKVKDVVSHILDTQLRVLSLQRDGYYGEQPPEINEYEDLVRWLNQLNSEWVKATQRLSPQTLILLLESIGDLVSNHYASLHPWDEALFPVAWAGESTSYNWMHLAREYTEYWHHQQQIRDAVNKQGIMSREFFYPVMSTFFQALPHTFRNTVAEKDTVIEARITSEAGGSWYLIKTADGWTLELEASSSPSAIVTIPIKISWILFSKSVRPHEIIDEVEIKGDEHLAKKVLEMVSVIA
ncbi:maleylpyruvate isomerase N-terminal domain-containing protein [Algoriphagus sp. AGSA1]|uniref:maleylpyruvate isomerase N-terminal domain-containing protein n=1 Tax=Algoriphagus sp. AGSA1 TaxID=2907213 RepID=UPI001F37343B|nr:maleylpyruvate isomerase N-terminal domain-containing protein [Algoriphagus sp. AGSA1]MCE7057270.1 maleylpyruvate isomerase N-terminal domain-containing protein [Algoriphagus sp. AGSA1]